LPDEEVETTATTVCQTVEKQIVHKNEESCPKAMDDNIKIK
jgi:hypothetical protein